MADMKPWEKYAATGAQPAAPQMPDGPWSKYQGQGQGTTAVVPPVSAAPSQDPTNPASPQPSMSAADVLTSAAKNFLPSAGQFVQDMAQPIMHPIDTANALGSVAGGVA